MGMIRQTRRKYPVWIDQIRTHKIDTLRANGTVDTVAERFESILSYDGRFNPWPPKTRNFLAGLFFNLLLVVMV